MYIHNYVYHPRKSKKYMFQTTNHIRLNPPRVEGTRFRFRWWLQILNRFFPKANLKILGHTHMLEKIPKSAGSG